MKLLKQTYKTFEGAQRRCNYENANESDYESAGLGRRHRYTTVQDEQRQWRVAQEKVNDDVSDADYARDEENKQRQRDAAEGFQE